MPLIPHLLLTQEGKPAKPQESHWD